MRSLLLALVFAPAALAAQTIAQTFIAPSGAAVRLRGINAPTLATGEFMFYTISAFSNGVLGPTLARLSLQESPGVAIEIGFSPILTPGATYAFTATGYTGAPTVPGLYLGGQAYTCSSGADGAACTVVNALPVSLSGFTATFDVTPSTVPEPTTIALFGAGLLAVGGVIRRRAMVG